MTGTAAVDTSALLAIANPRDQYHATAVAAARRHLGAGGRFVGSVLVLGELHGHLLHRRGPGRARAVLDAIVQDPAYRWVEVSPRLIAQASADWLGHFADQTFSLTDGVTFALMRAQKILVAFAYDDHFRVAGFDLLH